MKILVADQEVNHRGSLIDLISSLGHTALETIDSREVIKECRHKCPDLIFLDYMLSGVLAVDLIKQIRRLGGNATWNPIVVMGDKISNQEQAALVDAGADDYLIKPVPKINMKFKICTAKRQADLKDDMFTVAHDLVMANRALESAPTNDVLTGVMDMKNFYVELEKLWFVAKKTHSHLSLILLDLDNFREFNERYTAEHGDATLKLVAQHIKQQVSKIDRAVLARTVGVTFGILLPGVKQELAIKIADTLCTGVAELKIKHSGSSNGNYLTASVGVSTTDESHFKNPLDLLEATDFALYQAKHQGRNRVFFEAASMC
jgi:diguanylate cyclase (GGDEF)-like protein